MARGGVHGAKHLYCQIDLATDDMDCIPISSQNDKQTTAAMRHMLGDHPRRNYYSDNAKPLQNGAKACNMVAECALVGISETNGIAESNNKTILTGARRLLCHAGLPACWWPYAAPCYCSLRNIMLDINNESSYYEKHGMHFPGKAIPFGCLVYFVPAPTKDQRDKTAPRMRPGISMGYRLPPGGL